MNKVISILGIPMWLGQTRYGTNLGPEAVRAAGMIETIAALGHTVVDNGNIELVTTGQFASKDDKLKNLKQIAAASEKIAAKVAQIAAGAHFPLMFGGDHSITIGTIAGLAKYYNNLGVIWYDAHADMNTPETTPSGNIHGMPLAACMGLGHAALTGIGGYQGKVKAENIVLIGVRAIDEGERRLIANRKIKVYSADDVKRLGMARVMSETLSYLTARCDGIHLSFDLDGLDPAYAPGVGTPVTGGVGLSETMAALKMLYASEKITSAEFVEVNPILDPDNQTAALTVALAGALLGGEQGAKVSPCLYRAHKEKAV